jgi:hypothetical protein
MTTATKSQVCDVHVHLAALPEGDNGCYISKKMLGSPLFRYLCWKFKLPLDEPAKANAIYLEKLIDTLQSSQHVGSAVILGLDGVYQSDGSLDQAHTEFLISNKYVLQTVKRYPECLRAGVSINPQRRDALEELARCVEAGAALVKVLPNTQHFDPANKNYTPFYRALAGYGIPFLAHIGYEFSLLGKDQSVGDLDRLRIALEEGVTVIAAHGASYGLFFYEKHWKTFLEFARTYPNFYWDASALSLQNRVGMLLRIRRHPELHARMIFGTDYPLNCFAYPALLLSKIREYAELVQIKNPFDRHFRLLQLFGLPQPTPLVH